MPTPRSQLSKNREKCFDLGLGQCGGRLVQNQYPGIFRQRLCDLDKLLLADAEVADLRSRIDGKIEIASSLTGPMVKFRPVDHAEF